MAQYRHPGVYLTEIPGPVPIEGVSTDIAGLIGVAGKGLPNQAILITGWDQFVENFGDLIWNRYLAYAVYAFFLQGGNRCYVTRAAWKNDSGDFGQVPVPGSNGNAFTVLASSEGDWSTNLAIYIESDPPSAGPTAPLFSLSVGYWVPAGSTGISIPFIFPSDPQEQSLAFIQQYILQNKIPARPILDTDGTLLGYYYALESFRGLDPQLLQPSAPATGTAQDQIARINEASVFIRIQPDQLGRPTNTPTPLPFNQNNSGPADYDFASALQTFDPIEDISILAIPDLTGLADPTRTRAQIQNGLMYAQGKESLFFIADPPAGQNVQQIVDFTIGTGDYSGSPALNSSYGAIYYPWLFVLDPSSQRQIMLPPSGFVSGIYANTDQTAGVFKAPAGAQDGRLPGAVGVEQPLTDADQDVLNPIGINAIRNLLQIGIVVWGARTLSSNPPWKYVNVRRLLIFIEESLTRVAQTYVFEPNSTSLWALINRDFTDFLTIIWRQGALFGNTAKEAFFVQVDESNNPPSLRDRGELHIDVGVAPVKPAEFVIITIRQSVAFPG